MSYRSASLATTASVLLLGSSLIGAIGYFYWTSSKSRSKKANKKGQAAIPGLYNIGNTCYANALLQGLAGCPGFVTWLERIDASSLTADEESDKKEKTLFLDELKTTLLKLNDASLGTYSAANLIEALLSRKWLIAANSEQDLYELFNVFVTTWDEDLAVRASSFRTVSLLAIPTMCLQDTEQREMDFSSSTSRQSLSEIVMRSLSDAVVEEQRTRPPCVGLIATQLQCSNPSCAYKKVRHDRFCVLSLTIPKITASPMLTLELLLRKYFCIEQLNGATCDCCQEKRQMTGTGLIKKQGISKLPRCLIVRIERVGYLPSGAAFKHSDHVSFPETLDVRDLCFYRSKELDYQMSTRAPEMTSRILGGADAAGNSNPIGSLGAGLGLREHATINGGSFVQERRNSLRYRYQLRAVSVHRGRPDSGHFVTYRRGVGRAGQHVWYCANDAQVSRVSYQDVAAAQAYMLYYERMNVR